MLDLINKKPDGPDFILCRLCEVGNYIIPIREKRLILNQWPLLLLFTQVHTERERERERERMVGVERCPLSLRVTDTDTADKKISTITERQKVDNFCRH